MRRRCLGSPSNGCQCLLASYWRRCKPLAAVACATVPSVLSLCRWVAVNEIRILASLDPHPHVVNCMEGFLDGDHLCIVMEYMPGGELADIIQ